ncbi:MAG: recombinase family protein [Bacillota bacterium]
MATAKTKQKVVAIIPAKMEVETQVKTAEKLKNVVAYCRVSTVLEDQENSYETQIAYYRKLIHETKGWRLAGIYADHGKSATDITKRDDFNAMMNDCMRGSVDLVLTKSISRFARNTVDALQSIRKLKDKGIPVIFEKEGINTMESAGELLLTILSSQAQEESRNISMNTQWGVTRKFENGQAVVNHNRFLGYTKNEEGELVIVPEEAEIIRRIYRDYLSGLSLLGIARSLEKDGILTVTGKQKWDTSVICRILSNEKHCGDLLLQKTVTVDYLTHKRTKNIGQEKQYYIEDNHEAIIPKALFLEVQAEKARRRIFWGKTGEKKSKEEEKVQTAIEEQQRVVKKEAKKYSSKYALSSIIFCGECGHKYQRKMWLVQGEKEPVWRCHDRLKHGAKSCCTHSLTIKESDLHRAVMQAMSEINLNENYIDIFKQNMKNVVGELEDKNEVENIVERASRKFYTFDEELVRDMVANVVVKRNGVLQVQFQTGLLTSVMV